MKTEPKTFTFSHTIKLDRATIRRTLESVRDQLLRHEINGGGGGGKKFTMEIICDPHACGTAACIGGWASIFLLGFEGVKGQERGIVQQLFLKLHDGDKRLHRLFYAFKGTENYNTPNVAATAIQRYLDGKSPWPKGKMPDVLRYKRSATRIAR